MVKKQEIRKIVIPVREKVLLFGEPGTSKTFSLLSIVKDSPESLGFLIDPDAGAGKCFEELGGDKAFQNLEYRLTPGWAEIATAYGEAKGQLQEGDWLLIDQMGRLWDKAQEYYSMFAYKQTAADHLLEVQARKIAVKAKIEAAKERNPGLNIQGGGEMEAGGFETTKEWTVIKRLHNDQVVDDAVVRGTFNIMVTAAAKEITPLDTRTKSDFVKGWLNLFGPTGGWKPEGEKHNIYRFDTIAFLSRKNETDGLHYYALILRDRGRPELVLQKIDITGVGFWKAYIEART